jgi:hypothetical protein
LREAVATTFYFARRFARFMMSKGSRDLYEGMKRKHLCMAGERILRR